MDEHEALIEYSEMTSFNFKSKEFQEVQKDLQECENMVSSIVKFLSGIIVSLKIVQNY